MAIRIGCVPEHFSAPLVYAVEKSLLDVPVELVFCKLGTGDMVKRLVNGELDAAVCVTEGLVAGIAKNPGLRLVATYVDSPLPWAVSVATGAAHATLDDLAFGATFGISRKGSGSEVMARYASKRFEWKGQPKFEVLGDVHGLVAGVQGGKADAFMWERTTMQRHYDAGEVRYLGTVRPPWPAFSVGATARFVEANARALGAVFRAVAGAAEAFMALDAGVRAEFLKVKFGYERADADKWAEYVVFNGGGAVDCAKVGSVVSALRSAGVIEADEAREVVADIQ